MLLFSYLARLIPKIEADVKEWNREWILEKTAAVSCKPGVGWGRVEGGGGVRWLQGSLSGLCRRRDERYNKS